MNTKLSLFSISLLMTYFSFGQTEEVQAWKNAHPNILLIEGNDVNNDFLSVLEAKNQAYIIYQEDFTVNDIATYNDEHNIIVTESSAEDLMEIKIWKANHPGVVLISKADFDKMSQEKQQIFMNNNALIYAGEELVITEIRSYDEK